MKQDINLPSSLKTQAQTKSRARQKAARAEVRLQTIGFSSRNDLAPALKLEHRRISELKRAKRRSRNTTPAQLERVINGLKAFGYSAPALIDTNNRIVDGHIVVEACERLGIEKVQCVVIEHLSEDELRMLRLSLNRLVETGQWNIEELAVELEELKVTELDLRLSGFELPEIDIILGVTDLPGSKAPPEGKVPVTPVSRTGDLFQLGDHRMLCADFRQPDAFERLMDGRKLDCVFSDPPYNIKIEGVVSGLGKTKHNDFAMACGELSDEQFQAFLVHYLKLCKAHSATGAVIFACMDWRQIDLLLLAGRDAGLHRINMAIWNKGSGGMGGLYRSTYELITVFCSEKSPAINNVELGKNGRNRNNVWDYPGANNMSSSAKKSLSDHPTPKPVELVADALLDVTHQGSIVVDPFMGSGTTLVAAEQTGRIAYGLEIDPGYVDVTIKRWQEMTGKLAVHVQTGLTFVELAAERGNDTPVAAE